MIQVTCSHCGLRIQVPPTVQGKVGICFNCGQNIHVPTLSALKRHHDLAFEVGDSISDRYMIELSIGKGGMGVVYKARDTLINETVALKFMNPRMLRTEHGKKLFLQEAQIARRLRHDNIVAVHDVGWTDDGILYLSMEYAEGNSLRAFIRQKRYEREYPSVRLVVHFVSQVLDALHYAHRTVIHRDIKPENVMLLPGEKVKVLDFGLAKAVHEEFMQEDTTATNGEALKHPKTMLNRPPTTESKPKRVIGTFAYAAPEQKQHFPIDLRADIYSTGLVLYELLTLRTPMDPYIPVDKARSDIAPSLIKVLEKARELERDNRWGSALEFKAALEEAYETSYKPQINLITPLSNGRTVDTNHMAYLEGGSFLMGNNRIREEAPESEVTVAPFWMDIYPVTMRDYMAYVKDTNTKPPKFYKDSRYNGPDQPVVGITWNEAVAYATWAGKKLPTEIQWEFAARGKANRKYPWGNFAPDTTRCNYADYLGMTSNVTMHDGGVTPEGIYDLLGNVWEWTLDPFAPYAILRKDPDMAAGNPRKSARGGCWQSPPETLNCTARYGFFPESQTDTLGFRCILEGSR